MLPSELALDKIFSLFPLSLSENRFLVGHSPLSAKLYYSKKSFCLIQCRYCEAGVDDFVSLLQKSKLGESRERMMVVHLFYEFGEWLQEMEVDEETPLALVIDYGEEFEGKLNFPYSPCDVRVLSSPDYSSYKKAFSLGFSELLEGNSYQFNLTYPFKLSYKGEQERLFNLFSRRKDQVGAFAHLTHLPPLNTSILSNSPECLFQGQLEKKQFHLWSMPIKGTARVLESDRSYHEAYRRLLSSQKDEAELFMITDLIRNDLSSIHRPRSKVISLKCPLVVPGLVHQYSLIDIYLPVETSLMSVISKLFPGGSVTGAPKKNTMKILKKIEERPRRHYCGSTLLWRKGLLAASINIRTAEVAWEKDELYYNAGGGITVLSKIEDEFNEMYDKFRSFLKVL